MRKIGFVAAALGAIVIIALVWFTQFGVPAGPLVRSISDQIERRSDLVPRFTGAVKLALWPLGVVAEDFGLRNKTGSEEIFTAKRVQIGVSFSSLLTGHLRIKEVDFKGPVVRLAGASGRSHQTHRLQPGKAGALPQDHWLRVLSIRQLSAEDCTFIAHDEHDTKEQHIDAIRLRSLSPGADRLHLDLDVKSGARSLSLDVKAEEPGQFFEGKPMPIEAELKTEGLSEPARINAKLREAGPVLRAEALEGSFEGSPVSGAISVSFAGSKPYIEAQIETHRLDLTSLVGERHAATESAAEGSAPGALYSDKPISVLALHLAEADVRVSAAEVRLRDVRIAPASVEATLLDNTLTVALTQAGLYGGRAEGTFVVDASAQTPQLALRLGVADVQALPLLTDAVDFRHVEGRAQAQLDLKSAGASLLRAVSTLQGTAKLNFTDGALRGIDLNDMVHSLLHRILSGWQESPDGKTQFSTFHGSFDVQNGRATTKDLQFEGPHVRLTAAGTADLVRQTLNFRTDPKLTMDRSDQGGRDWSIGVPVTIKGTWSQPKIYPELQGILNNPEGILGEFRKRRHDTGDSEGSAAGEQPLGKLFEGLIRPRDQSRPATGKRRPGSDNDTTDAKDSDADTRTNNQDRPFGRFFDQMQRRRTDSDDGAPPDAKDRPLGKFLDQFLGDRPRGGDNDSNDDTRQR